MNELQKQFFSRSGINPDVLAPLHSGIALYDKDAVLIYGNDAYLNMYKLNKENYAGIRAVDLFLTAKQGILEVLKTGKVVTCTSVTHAGYYGVTYRYPLRDKSGAIIGCMTENLSVGMDRQRILEMRNIIDELNRQDDSASITQPRQEPQNVTFDTIVGESSAMRLLKSRGRRFAQHDEPILILGENGTGKDMVARALHAASTRHEKNFVSVNCAALPHDLIESELFGYDSGAFTGARPSGKKGKFEMAEGGTIFLDEIGELPLKLQAKLLRVLENHEIQKIGSALPAYVDFRLISATNRDLGLLVERGQFREDLFYRLNLFDLVVPPLRDRLADIPLLAYSFIHDVFGPERGSSVRISPEVLSLFSAHAWRGNVRELRNIVVYALYSMGPGEDTLGLQHLPERFFGRNDSEFLQNTLIAGKDEQRSDAPFRAVSAVTPPSMKQSRTEAEKEAILAALRRTGGNRVQAAQLLGIARSNLYKKMRLLGITGDKREL